MGCCSVKLGALRKSKTGCGAASESLRACLWPRPFELNIELGESRSLTDYKLADWHIAWYRRDEHADWVRYLIDVHISLSLRSV